jgi:predicted RNA-binding protein with RPS1 domain
LKKRKILNRFLKKYDKLGKGLNAHRQNIFKKEKGIMDEMNTTIDTLDIAAEAAAPVETMDQYAKELDATMRTINVGDILDGTVVGITDTEVTVDLQYAAEGIIRNQDYSSEPGFSVKENVKPGDEIKAVVKKLDDGNGNILLSRKEAADAIAWDNLKKMMEEKATILVTVKEAVKGGVVTYIDGIRAFIPASSGRPRWAQRHTPQIPSVPFWYRSRQ